MKCQETGGKHIFLSFLILLQSELSGMLVLRDELAIV